jgi:hypothetical protein
MTARAPDTSMISTSGRYTARIRADAIAARNLPTFSRSKRCSSQLCRLYAWTRATLLNDSSATALSEPLRRLRSRDATLISREKCRAALQNSGTMTSARSVRSHWR